MKKNYWQPVVFPCFEAIQFVGLAGEPSTRVVWASLTKQAGCLFPLNLVSMTEILTQSRPQKLLQTPDVRLTPPSASAYIAGVNSDIFQRYILF